MVIIDELADLMMVVGKKIEETDCPPGAKGPCGGIHLILATQRPSVDVITGLIKANIPTGIAPLQVGSKIDSRTILDQMGRGAAGHGRHALHGQRHESDPVHGAFVSRRRGPPCRQLPQRTRGESDYIEGALEGGTVDGDGDRGRPVGRGARR